MQLAHWHLRQLYTPLELMTLTAAISACGEWQKALRGHCSLKKCAAIQWAGIGSVPDDD